MTCYRQLDSTSWRSSDLVTIVYMRISYANTSGSRCSCSSSECCSAMLTQMHALHLRLARATNMLLVHAPKAVVRGYDGLCLVCQCGWHLYGTCPR